MNLLEFIIVNNPFRRLIQVHVEMKGFLDVPSYVTDGKVIEIGCGSGYGTKLISAYFKPSKIYGIDIDEKMIRLAKKNKLPHVTFSVGDVTNLSFKDNSIDGVFDFVILHHIADWKKALDEIYRVLNLFTYV